MTRKQAIETLESYLCNPGQFSILILGERGTGKTHWLNNIYTRLYPKFKKIEVKAALVNNNGRKEWEELLKKANEGILIIDEVEKLEKISQEFLFETMETGPGGKFGFQTKKYQLRIAFTSSLSIDSLRDKERYLLHKFFDRIAQLVVKFPSYREQKPDIRNDFTDTWNKMQFPQKEFPGDDLIKWLSEIADQLHGNFRDLDKIAINWRNHQLRKISADKILAMVKNEFNNFYRFPEHKEDMDNAFYIDRDQDYKNEMLPEFRKFVKQYALKIHNGNIKGKRPFGVPHRTMEAW